ncbi:conserved hypothetical protein, partial [Ricinus communis]
AHRARQRQAPRGQHEMAAAQGTQPGAGTVQRPRPRTRRIDDDPCAHLVVGTVAGQYRPAHAIAGPEQLVRAEIVDRRGAMIERLAQHAQHEAGVVRARVRVDDAAREAVALHVRRRHQEGVGIEPVPLAPARHHVVDREAGQEAAPAARALVLREREALRFDEAGGAGKQHLALAHGFRRQPHVAILQVAQAA